MGRDLWGLALEKWRANSRCHPTCQTKGKCASSWLLKLLARKPRKLAAVALAHKMARILWAMAKPTGTHPPERQPNAGAGTKVTLEMRIGRTDRRDIPLISVAIKVADLFGTLLAEPIWCRGIRRTNRQDA